jgi:hypothetical protein
MPHYGPSQPKKEKTKKTAKSAEKGKDTKKLPTQQKKMDY